MPTITWDTAFEAIPADTDEAKYGADVIRDAKLAISERLELEMNFKTGTQPLIKAGKAAVIYSGTTEEITALTGMATGAFAWDTTLKVLKRYSGSAWVVLDIDHGLLSGLLDDDHTQYLNLTKAGQELTESLTVTALKTIDGRDLSVDGAKLDGLPPVTTAARAYRNGTQNIPANTWTKVELNAESFDVGNNFDAVTNFRYVAPVDGRYLVSVNLHQTETNIYSLQLAIYKNNALFSQIKWDSRSVGVLETGRSFTDILDLVATDYVEMFFRVDVTTSVISSGSDLTFMAVCAL